MRKQRDGEDTRQRVLAAAEEQFAQHGFSGTSLADISQQCGISDGLILHHFQSKKNLYHQVLEKLADQYAEVLIQAKGAASTPGESIRQTLRASFNFWKQDAAYQRISLWAHLEGNSEYAGKEAALTSGLAQSVIQLQEQGLLDDRYSPAVLLTMIIGPIHFWLRYREQFKVSLHLSETPDELDSQFIDQLIQLVSELSLKKG
jgi:TetR/AcrR family transcriptional regulator